MSDEPMDVTWEIEENVRCVVCPECAFTFDAIHTGPGDDEYHCPLCEEAALIRRAEAAEEDWQAIEAQRDEAVALLRLYADEERWTDGVFEMRAEPNRDHYGSIVDWTGIPDNGAAARAFLASFPQGGEK